MPNLLSQLADNPNLLEAVRAVMNKQFEAALVTTMTNELLGQIMRARIDGLNAIERAFKEIESYKTRPVSPEKGNPGA